MIARLLDTLFRYKLLLLIPPVLIPLLVGPIAIMTTPVYYEVFAGVWVDRPTYLTYNDDFNRYLSPAQNQIGRLNELLRSRSFIDDVAKQTSLAALVGSAAGEDRIQSIIGGGVAMFPSGEHLVVLRFRGPTAQLSYDLVNALVTAYKDRAAADRTSQAAVAISFYQGRMQTSQDELDKSSNALRRYLSANPRLGNSGSGNAAAAVDPQLAALQHQIQFNQADLDRIRSSLDQAQVDAAAALEGQDMGFQVIDPPQLPTAPVRALRQRIIYPVAGLLGGLGISLVLLVLLVAADRSVRSVADLTTSARVLGVVPRLQLKRISTRKRPEAMRRAIGFVAGAALPAPGTGGTR